MKLLQDMVKEGMSDVASELFRKAVTEGISSTNRFIKDKTGLDISVENPLQDNYTSRLKTLKEVKINNDKQIEDYSQIVKIHGLEIKDRMSARKSYTSFIGKDNLKELFLPILSIFIYIVCFSGLLLLVTVGGLDESLTPTIFTTLSVILLTVAQFWFGSSKASKELDGRES